MIHAARVVVSESVTVRTARRKPSAAAIGIWTPMWHRTWTTSSISLRRIQIGRGDGCRYTEAAVAGLELLSSTAKRRALHQERRPSSSQVTHLSVARPVQ